MTPAIRRPQLRLQRDPSTQTRTTPSSQETPLAETDHSRSTALVTGDPAVVVNVSRELIDHMERRSRLSFHVREPLPERLLRMPAVFHRRKVASARRSRRSWASSLLLLESVTAQSTAATT